MDDKQSLSHTKWECKYHLVWIPKYRKKDLYGGLRKYLGSCFKDLASQKESQILEGHLKPDHEFRGRLGDVDSYSALYLTQVFQFFRIPICHVKPG